MFEVELAKDHVTGVNGLEPCCREGMKENGIPSSTLWGGTGVMIGGKTAGEWRREERRGEKINDGLGKNSPRLRCGNLYYYEGMDMTRYLLRVD